MNAAEPLCPEPGPAQDYGPDTGAGMHWVLAINLIAAWRGTGDVHRQALVAQRLVEMAEEGGVAAVERAALGLTDVAGTLLELYAAAIGALPGDVLTEVATVLCDKSRWG
jgi:hypothetical protein